MYKIISVQLRTDVSNESVFETLEKKVVPKTAAKKNAKRRKVALTTTEIIDVAIAYIKNKRTDPSDRREVAVLLSTLGVFVHGNLGASKLFNPDKIQVLGFDTSFRMLRGYQSVAVKALKVQKVLAGPELNKTNKLVVNLAFNVTVQVAGCKARRWVTVPLKVPDYALLKMERGELRHSETALYDALGKPNNVRALIQRLKTKEPALYKINAVVLQMSSTFRSCDACHDQGRPVSASNASQFVYNLNNMSRRLGVKVPSKKTKGIAFAVQFAYDFSPDGRGINSYTRPLVFPGTSPRANFVAEGMFYQRLYPYAVYPDIGDFSTVVSPYTVFISNGSYPDCTAHKKLTEAKKRNILAHSIEKEDPLEALREWRFSGFKETLEKGATTSCEYCDNERIRNVYEIENRYNGNTLTVGSDCILEFDEIEIADSSGLLTGTKDRKSFVKGGLNREKKVRKVLDFLDGLFADASVVDSPITKEAATAYFREHGKVPVHVFMAGKRYSGQQGISLPTLFLPHLPTGEAPMWELFPTLTKPELDELFTYISKKEKDFLCGGRVDAFYRLIQESSSSNHMGVYRVPPKDGVSYVQFLFYSNFSEKKGWDRTSLHFLPIKGGGSPGKMGYAINAARPFLGHRDLARLGIKLPVTPGSLRSGSKRPAPDQGSSAAKRRLQLSPAKVWVAKMNTVKKILTECLDGATDETLTLLQVELKELAPNLIHCGTGPVVFFKKRLEVFLASDTWRSAGDSSVVASLEAQIKKLL